LSLVFYNEYGLATSLQLVENYLRKVQWILQNIFLPNREKQELKKEYERIHKNWTYLSHFHRSREKLKKAKAFGIIEQTSRWVFRLMSKWDISFIHRNLAEQLCRFHSILSSSLQK
jgi:hypothetical protein